MTTSSSWIDVSSSSSPQSSGRQSTKSSSGRNSPTSSTSTLKSSGGKQPLITSMTPPLREKTRVSTTSALKSSRGKPPSREPSEYDKVGDWLRTLRLEDEFQGFEECDDCPSLDENSSVGRRDSLERDYVNVGTRERGGRDVGEGATGRGKGRPKKVKKTKKKKKKKNKSNVFTRLEKTGQSVVDLNTTEGIMRLVHAIHPRVVCGHKNCLTTDIVTPKDMGWLWTVEKIGGIQVSRNWRPGAIPKDVAIVMERTRSGYYKEEAAEIAARKELFDYTMRMRRKIIFAKHLGHAPGSRNSKTKVAKSQMMHPDVVSSVSGGYDSVVSN